MTWREFRDFIRGLLYADTRLYRQLAPKPESKERDDA